MARRGTGSRRRNDFYPLILLFGTLQEIGLDRIPPVTLLFFAINVAVYFLAEEIPLVEVCNQPHSIIMYGDYHRLILSTFFHADSWHLYYNMASHLYKGLKLERMIGSSRLFVLIVISSVLTSVLYVLIAVSLANIWQYDGSYASCAVGFSAVLFALKTALNQGSTTYSRWFGLSVPTKYLCWFELAFISIVTPNASFLGHLCGILVGLLYSIGLMEPLFKITDLLGIDRIFTTLAQGYNYDQYAAPPNERRGRGGMGRMHGMGGFGRRGYGY